MVVNVMFEKIKMVEYGFIHGYAPNLLKKRFNNFDKKWLKCPLDGGRWDSNQHQGRLVVVLRALLKSFVLHS